jgi:outer membrane protein assembly factor BamE (lipoprotein component of BamABCDE complex)
MIVYIRTFIFLASLFIIGFGNTIYTHGTPWVVLDLWKQINMGDNKEQVMHHLGPPTLISKFNENIWYYISYKIKQANFLGRKKYSSRSIQISFDHDGKVINIKEINVSSKLLVDIT